jgi:phage-related protein (TIGR01555 family)
MAFKFWRLGSNSPPTGFSPPGGVSPETSDSAGAVITPQEMYDAGGISARIVDVLAEEMTRAGFELSDIPDAAKKQAEQTMKNIGFEDALTRAIREANISGGAIIFFGVSGSADQTQPAPKKSDVLFCRVVGKESIAIQERYGKENLAKIGMPEILQLNFADGTSLEVHESRCAFFYGSPASEARRQQNEGWGNSLIDTCRNAINNYESGLKWANRIIERNHQGVLKSPDLGKNIKDKSGRALMMKRLMKLDMFRGPTNTLAIDKEEEYELKGIALTGTKDILDKNKEALSADSGIPQLVLYGDQPSGMSATGSVSLEIWYGRVGQAQRTQCAPAISMLVEFQSGSKPEVKFNPLHVASDQEQATTRKTNAEADKIYWEVDAVSSGELRESNAVADYYNIDPRIQVNNGGDEKGKTAKAGEEKQNGSNPMDVSGER